MERQQAIYRKPHRRNKVLWMRRSKGKAQEYFNTPLVNRAISIIDELSDVDPSNPPNPTGNPFRDVITKAYCDSVLVTQGCFPEEKAYRFMFLVPEIQAYTGMLVVHVISDSGKEAMKQGLTVCSIFGGQLCSVRLPSNA